MGWGDATDRVMRACTRAFAVSGGVTYNPAVGDPYTIANVIFDKTWQAVDPDTGAIIQSTQPRIGVRIADMDTEPAEGDTVDVGGTRYRVLQPEPDGGGGLNIPLHAVGPTP